MRVFTYNMFKREKKEMTYHLLRRKEWVNGGRDRMLKLEVEALCGEEVLVIVKKKREFQPFEMVKYEKKKHKELLCKDCIKRFVFLKKRQAELASRSA